jgi:4-amino-4-deoxy-L-arabinose transferase-like glycosyltransferase
MAPVIGIVLFALEARARRRVPRGNYVVPILTLIVIPLLWLVPAIVMGGGGFAHDVLVKQTAGRAIGAWVHKSPPWFYLTHAPATLFPWFLLLVAAIVAIYRRGGEPDPFGHFCVRWILAVLVPYSLLSSKLDVYMMAMIPPVAIVIARFATTPADDVHARWGRRVNAIMMIVLLAVGAAGVLLPSTLLRPADREIASQTSVRLLFAVLAIAALIALIVAARQRTVTASTIALGLVPLAALIYAATALVPLANTFASARPLVAGLARLDIPPEQIALFTCPQLWTRDMPRSLERVRYVDADAFRDPHFRPLAIATSRRYAADIGPALGEYRRVDQVQMIGKWFDVYRR